MAKTMEEKSTSGTKHTAEMPKPKRRRRTALELAPKTNKFNDIGLLLLSAGKAGVSELSFEGLEVKFHQKAPIAEEHTALVDGAIDEKIYPSHTKPSYAPSTFSEDFPQEDINEVMVSPEDRARLEEIREEQLMLDDPIAYEEESIMRLMGNSVHA